MAADSSRPTFEQLLLGPETVASLAAEGIEKPTPFQAAAIPVIARGRDVMGRVGPGSGTLVGYGAPLIDRLEGGVGAPVCLVLCTGTRQATELARSLTRLCAGADLRVAALAPHWNLPHLADFLVVPSDRIAALYDGAVAVDRVRAVVIHDGDGLVRSVPRDHLEALLTGLPSDCQRIFCGLPFGPEYRAIARRFTRRAATIPPGDARPQPPARKPEPGLAQKAATPRALQFIVVEDDREDAVLSLAADLLESGGARHVLVFTATVDQAADVGDLLAMHGYASGPLGDASVPVWLCPGDEEARADAKLATIAASEKVATISFTVPSGTASATARHGAGGPSWALAAVREIGHLRQVAASAGLALKRHRPERVARVSTALAQLADRIHEASRAPEAMPYYLLVESLQDRFTAAEVAAAALLLLDRDGGKAVPASAPHKSGAVPESWVRLFVSAGRRDQIGPRELLGALTSESGVAGKRVGRIDVRESHSLVEVYESDAKKVIAALNGITLGGRSLRVDYDRAKDRRPGKPGGRRGVGPAGGPRRPSRPGAAGAYGKGRSRPPRRGRP